MDTVQQELDMAGRNSKGWRAVIGCAIAIFFTGANVFGFAGVCMGYWIKNYPGAGGTIMTALLISLGFGMFLCGKWHMKLGTRKMFIIGAALQAIANLCLIFGDSVIFLYLWSFFTGANSCFIYSPGLGTAQNWFPNKRGLCTGIVNLIFGGSSAIMVPIVNGWMNTYGYIKMNWIVLVCSVVVTLIGAMMAEMPDRTPMTDAQRAAHKALFEEVTNAKKGVVMAPSVTPSEATKTFAFWMFWLVWLFMGSAGISMVSLSKTYSMHLGIAGVAALTSFNLTNGVSRIISGYLSDVVGRRAVAAVSFIIGGVGYALLPSATNETMLCVYCAMVGYAFGTMFAISAPLASDLFGLKYFGLIFGLIFTAYGFVGGVAGPILSTYVLKATGSYTMVFGYLAVFCFISAVCILLTKKKAA